MCERESGSEIDREIDRGREREREREREKESGRERERERERQRERELRVWSVWIRAQGSEVRDWGSGFGVQWLGFMDWGFLPGNISRHLFQGFLVVVDPLSRLSRPDYGLSFQVKTLQTFYFSRIFK